MVIKLWNITGQPWTKPGLDQGLSPELNPGMIYQTLVTKIKPETKTRPNPG